MKANEIIIIFVLLISVNSFDFGKTNVDLGHIDGATVTLIIKTQNSGTTEGSDLKILNAQIACSPGGFYDLTCISNKPLQLSSEGTNIQCSASESFPTSSSCVLLGQITVSSTHDTYNVKPKGKLPGPPKFGNIQLDIVSVEGNKTIIKIIPEREGETATVDFTITNLTVNNKALTCIAGKKITLVPTQGTQLECFTSVPINGNIACSLGGSPIIINSLDDSFDTISVKKTKVYSLFGTIKIGILNAKGTYITIQLIPEYEGNTKVNITGLQINKTRLVECPAKTVDLTKEGYELECTISQGVKEEERCELTQSNLQSNPPLKLEINEAKNSCIARESKYGKVNIYLAEVYGRKVTILIKTTFFGRTESDKFVIDGLKLNYDNKDYIMTCSLSSKIDFLEDGTRFTCTVSSIVNGGKICSLKGVATFNSPGDTFSDIAISTESVYSSFGKITLTPVTLKGRELVIRLTSEITGTTRSSISSINNLKIGNKDLSCPIGVDINFSDKPEFTCTLDEEMAGGQSLSLRGDSPSIIKPENSKDILGDIILSTSSVTSSYGKLLINLLSVEGDTSIISLSSEFVGSVQGLNVNSLYLEGKLLKCQSTGVELILKNREGNSNAQISCKFSSSSYSQESDTECTLTGTPTTSKKIFTSVVIGKNTVTSGIRNFGETIIYLYQIKGTTVTIQIKPSLSGKVRPIINNLKLQAGSEFYDVICNVADKKQLYSGSKTSIKCYITRTIDVNTQCRLYSENVTITSDSKDIFGNIVISTDAININIKPTQSSFGDTKIILNSVHETQVNINIQVSSTTIYSSATPTVYGLKIGSSELICVSNQILTFSNNIAQMSCTSSSPITCTDCQLSGTPIIVSSGDEEATFGNTLVETIVVGKTQSTIGNVSINLNRVIGNSVYIGITSTNNVQSYQKVDISNLYIDGQKLICNDEILFSTSGTEMLCKVEEPIPYNKPVTLTGTPNIKFDSVEESVDAIKLVESPIDIISKPNAELYLELLSVKENIAIFSITPKDLPSKTTFTNFTIIGLAINNIPFEIYLDSISLSNNNPYKIKVTLNDTIERGVLCTLNGVSSSQILAYGSTFKPIARSTTEVYSTSFKFGIGEISILYAQGNSVILRVSSSKKDYTKNTEINGLYINDNIPLICKIKDDIEFSSEGADIECKLSEPMTPGVECALSYKGDIESDENFEKIEIVYPKSVISQDKYFGDVNIGLKDMNGKMVKLFIQTAIQNTTTTNNIKIKNLLINKESLICECDEQIEFVKNGNEFTCILNTLESSETYTLSGNNIEIESFGDRFGTITIDEKNRTIKTKPRDIDGLTISLSSLAGNRASIKVTSPYEIYTDIKINNLKIINGEGIYANQYDLICPKVDVNLNEKNLFTIIIICELGTKLASGQEISLVDNRKVIEIESYDNFEEIIIETNEIKSTNAGDIFLDFIDSSIALNLSSIISYELESFDIYNLLLSSSLELNCSTPGSIKIKPAGTVIYCSLKGINKLQGIPYVDSYYKDVIGNIYLNQKSNNDLKSGNCYAFYNRESCESNQNCIYSKETYGYCGYNYDTKNSGINNECILYINKDSCESNDKCIWNEENKYICKNRQIKNCKKIHQYLDICEECETYYKVNSEGKCILDNNTTVYQCREYEGAYKCNSKAQCEYSYESYNYCTSQDDYKSDISNCYLYITKESCVSQYGCSWRTNYESGCKEKYIDHCAKLKEADPTSCEKCEDGYTKSGKICIENRPPQDRDPCDIDDENLCKNLDYCVMSDRGYCYGEGNCYLILDKTTCVKSGVCYWNVGKWEKCQIKGINNCLQLSKDLTRCEECQEGYTLTNYETTCEKVFPNCFRNGFEKEECLENNKCEFSEKEFCQSRYYDYYDDYNKQCSIYLDKNLCLNNTGCIWNNMTEAYCKIKSIDNCLQINYDDTNKCAKCKDGFYLTNENTQCQQSSSYFIKISMMSFVLILMLF